MRHKEYIERPLKWGWTISTNEFLDNVLETVVERRVVIFRTRTFKREAPRKGTYTRPWNLISWSISSDVRRPDNQDVYIYILEKFKIHVNFSQRTYKYPTIRGGRI